jgi:8-oxo-dGTP pyrophosphatase MutT (NUDIX family)
MTRSRQLLEQLRAHTPADEVESSHRRAMLDLLAAGDSFSRHHFLPGHFTASCFVLDREGRLLLHHHKRLGRWLQLGGHVEGDESTREAALREAREESGLYDLDLDEQFFDLDVHPIPEGRSEPGHHHFDVRYVARASSGAALRRDPAESNDLAWVSTARAAELMYGEESRRVLQKIERIVSGRSVP